ncbi:MAG: HDOD domain-containing protein [Bacillota bacterium]|nr:HDOD domain-containing protein [Bacillota bacterium]
MEGLRKVVNSLGRIPEIRPDFKEIFSILKNQPSISEDQLSKRINEIDGLADFIINLSNNKYINKAGEITSICGALKFMGTPAIENLILFFMTKKLFPIKTESNRAFDSESFWKHCLGTSAAGMILAKRNNYPEPQRIFTYGLIHDIGISVLNYCEPEYLDRVITHIKNGLEMSDAEKAVLKGLNHELIGAWFCQKTGVNENIANVVQYHHTPFIPKGNADEHEILYLADLISSEYYYTLLGISQDQKFYDKFEPFNYATKKDVMEVSLMLPKEVEKLQKDFI